MIDPVEDYLKLLKTIFDFRALKALLARPDFKFTFDGLHGVAGPYARRIFVRACLFTASQPDLAKAWQLHCPACGQPPLSSGLLLLSHQQASGEKLA